MDSADQFIGEIRIFAGNYAPEGWAFCNGQVMPITGNDSLFSLIGYTYGGSGPNFQLPDLRSRVAIHQSQQHVPGSFGGAEATTLKTAQLPPHSHVLGALATDGTAETPVGNVFAGSGSGDTDYSNANGNVTLGEKSITPVGGNESFSIIQPSLGISYIIALSGIYPPQT